MRQPGFFDVLSCQPSEARWGRLECHSLAGMARYLVASVVVRVVLVAACVARSGLLPPAPGGLDALVGNLRDCVTLPGRITRRSQPGGSLLRHPP